MIVISNLSGLLAEKVATHMVTRLFIVVGNSKKIDEETESLQKSLERLMQENASWRVQVEEAMAIIRQRAPNADGLSLKSGIKTILDDRDSSLSRIDFYRDFLKKILKLLIENRSDDAKKELNVFLFNNKK